MEVSTTSGSTAAPFNPVTGNTYSGQNEMLLQVAQSVRGYTAAQWAGFVQWQQAGRVVKKGEKATEIIMMKSKKLTSPTGEIVIKKFPSGACVFNIEQTELKGAE